MVCTPIDADANTPATECLERPYFGMHRFEWPDGSVNFYLTHGDWVRLLRANDFEIDGLIEIQAPVDASTTYPIVTPEWARKWPSEEIWKARKRQRPPALAFELIDASEDRRWRTAKSQRRGDSAASSPDGIYTVSNSMRSDRTE